MQFRKFIGAFLVGAVCAVKVVGQDWKMQPVTIPTRWAKEVSPENALKEYPRPQLVREGWVNLNGLWEYAITERDSVGMRGKVGLPEKWDGKILVPYPVESALSGVKRALQPEQWLWYRRSFDRPKGERVLLHFGAVDFQAVVFVNGKEVGGHVGGYEAFTMDVTDVLKAGLNELVVRVYDPTDKGVGPHGKQVLNPAVIHYTATSGIWQTVWMEGVAKSYVEGLVLTPDIDKGVLEVQVNAVGGNGSVEVEGLDAGKIIGVVRGKAGVVLRLLVKEAKLWSPGSPFLYDLRVRLVKGGKVVDEVASYFGMRKIALGKDNKGVTRIFLNNQPYFNLGTLDQGFWPDGLYTAPTDAALRFDIEAIKAMGFNTIRKHIKIEPARWYYHCDKLGMLVWQDFVNPNVGLPEGAKGQFEKEVKEVVEQLHNSPSVVTWNVFNEHWGVYDQERLTKWVKELDPTRLVNGHSGEYIVLNENELKVPVTNWAGSDITDVHSYPNPMNAPALDGKARVLGEFGGIGVFIADHQWNPLSGFGYIEEKPAAMRGKFAIMMQHVRLLEGQGLSASIYTQPFDVEGEQNGLMTYDREVVKIPFDELRKIHAPLNPVMGTVPAVVAANADLREPAVLYSAMLEEYIQGKREPQFLSKMAKLAKQVGDGPGAVMAGNDYIAGLKAPLREEDLQFIGQFTKSSNDKGFALMQQYPNEFKKVLGERQYQVNMMNMVFHGVMEPMLREHKSWDEIETAMKAYGEPGDEMFLRAKTVTTLNAKDWKNYVPAAKAYLEKYIKNIKQEERENFENGLKEAKRN